MLICVPWSLQISTVRPSFKQKSLDFEGNQDSLNLQADKNLVLSAKQLEMKFIWLTLFRFKYLKRHTILHNSKNDNTQYSRWVLRSENYFPEKNKPGDWLFTKKNHETKRYECLKFVLWSPQCKFPTLLAN